MEARSLPIVNLICLRIMSAHVIRPLASDMGIPEFSQC